MCGPGAVPVCLSGVIRTRVGVKSIHGLALSRPGPAAVAGFPSVCLAAWRLQGGHCCGLAGLVLQGGHWLAGLVLQGGHCCELTGLVLQGGHCCGLAGLVLKGGHWLAGLVLQGGHWLAGLVLKGGHWLAGLVLKGGHWLAGLVLQGGHCCGLAGLVLQGGHCCGLAGLAGLGWLVGSCKEVTCGLGWLAGWLGLAGLVGWLGSQRNRLSLLLAFVPATCSVSQGRIWLSLCYLLPH